MAWDPVNVKVTHFSFLWGMGSWPVWSSLEDLGVAEFVLFLV